MKSKVHYWFEVLLLTSFLTAFILTLEVLAMSTVKQEVPVATTQEPIQCHIDSSYQFSYLVEHYEHKESGEIFDLDRKMFFQVLKCNGRENGK